MKLPDLILVGKQGWKKREFERRVLLMVERSTNPQSGWSIFQKLNRKKNYTHNGKEICEIMYELYKIGYLERVGFDRNRDSIYVIK